MTPRQSNKFESEALKHLAGSHFSGELGFQALLLRGHGFSPTSARVRHRELRGDVVPPPDRGLSKLFWPNLQPHGDGCIVPRLPASWEQPSRELRGVPSMCRADEKVSASASLFPG